MARPLAKYMPIIRSLTTFRMVRMVSVLLGFGEKCKIGGCGVVFGPGFKKGGQAIELVLAFEDRGVEVVRDDHVVNPIRVVCRRDAGLNRRLRGVACNTMRC